MPWTANIISDGINSYSGWGLGDVEQGEWFIFSDVDLGDGYDQLDVQLGSTQSGSLDVRIGSSTGIKIGEVSYSPGSDWNTFVWNDGTLTAGSGTQDLYLVMTSGTANVSRIRLIDQAGNARLAPVGMQQAETLKVYPNPVVGEQLTVQFPEDGPHLIRIYNSSGQMIYKNQSHGKLSKVPASVFTASGIYLLRSSGSPVVYRLLVE